MEKHRRTSDSRLDNIENDVRDMKVAFLGDLKENKEGLFTRMGKAETKIKLLIVVLSGILARVLYASIVP